ncbi:MAG: hypothetical protein LUO89_01325 [Methanothrix sp.]|nr:hypothetical protein [Methanothrix sp.]
MLGAGLGTVGPALGATRRAVAQWEAQVHNRCGVRPCCSGPYLPFSSRVVMAIHIFTVLTGTTTIAHFLEK